MKKTGVLLTALIIIISLIRVSFSQSNSEIEWLSQLDKKTTASYSDAVTLFMLQLGKKSSTFEQDSALLASEGIALEGYSQESSLTKGMISKMSAAYLDLGGSFMYLIFNSERYAYKACIANGIFTEDGSSNDVISGPVLIEVFAKISALKGEQK